MRYLLRALLVLSYVVRPLLAARQLILPHPQQIEYGSGRLPLRGASIGLGSETGPEDRFAANELASALSLMAGTTIPVVVGPVNRCPPASAIVLVRTGPVDALPGPDDHAGADSREAYEIRIDSRGAEIRARSSAGLYYGVQTMRQLVEGDSGDSFLPDVTIHDWPALAYRGFMMDVSHGALPTEDEIKRQIDFLARWKVNQYYLYAEAQIELRGYDLVNPDDRYSQDQIRQIVAYARDRHVDVIPWPNFYGHLHELFRIERYANLSLFPHGDEINPLNEQAQALLEDWTRQLAALFPSPWFNVGFDEQWELSRAKRILGNSVDPAQVYVNQLKRSAELLHQLNKRPMFLANPCGGSREFSQHPELISELPKYIVAAPWRFYPAFEDLPDYSACVAPFAREHIATFVVPGIWCWDNIAPDFTRSFENIDGFALAARKYGSLGLINSGWNDFSYALYRAALPGMAYGAVAAWQSEPVDRKEFFREYAFQMYPAQAAADVALALEKLSSAEYLALDALDVGDATDTIDRLWGDPLSPARLRSAEANRAKLRQVRLLAEDAEEQLQRALEITHDTYSLQSLLVDARMLDYTAMRYIYAAEIAGFFKTLGRKPAQSDVHAILLREIWQVDHGRIADMMKATASLRDQYQAAWRQQYTDYALGVILAHFDAELEFWRQFAQRLWDTANTFKDGDTLPTLEELRPHW
ncbi:MAG: hypothetical protein DMG25_10775 [Acidobacteria bacterium]|nr:MAG: hypothetical protein DMG25_10775 [Acidobacteriota bacterium]